MPLGLVVHFRNGKGPGLLVIPLGWKRKIEGLFMNVEKEGGGVSKEYGTYDAGW